MMKGTKAIHQDLNAVVNYIVAQRSYGGFGSTQATILALKALTEYARLSGKSREGGIVRLIVNSQEVEEVSYSKDVSGELRTTGWETYLTAGTQQVRVKFENTEHALPYSVNVRWSTKTPNADTPCKVKLQVDFKEKQTDRNETVRMDVTLTNKTSDGLPMTVALVGIPAGLSLQPWQLKELQEKRVFDYYEIVGQYLVLYYTALAPSAIQTVNLDLKADIPGTFLSPASSAYLYYTNEHKDWVAGSRVEVRDN